jgi:hypothetical protein
VSVYFDYWGQVYQCFRIFGSRQPKAGFSPKQSEVRGFWSEEIEKNVHDFRKSAQVVGNQQNGSASQAAYEGSIPFTRSNSSLLSYLRCVFLFKIAKWEKSGKLSPSF